MGVKISIYIGHKKKCKIIGENCTKKNLIFSYSSIYTELFDGTSVITQIFIIFF